MQFEVGPVTGAILTWMRATPRAAQAPESLRLGIPSYSEGFEPRPVGDAITFSDRLSFAPDGLLAGE